MSEIAEHILDEASIWVVRMADADVTEELRLEFDAWLQANPDHVRAFKMYNPVWRDLDTVMKSDEVIEVEERLNLSPLPLAGRLKSVSREIISGSAKHARQWQSWAVAACFVLMVGGVVTAQLNSGHITEAEYQTAVGAVETIILPDESTMIVNTGSRVRIAYSRDARNIYLEQGEAHFDVMSNAKRPFNVMVGDQVVRAIGTAFSVKLKQNNISVVVSEGRVLMRPDPEKLSPVVPAKVGNTQKDSPMMEPRSETPQGVPEQRAILRAGSRADFNEARGIQVSQLAIEEIERKLSWRHGGLIFEKERLEDVIDVIREYTPTQINIIDAELRDMPVGGYFPIGEVDSMLSALEAGFGLDVRRIENGPIEIRESTVQ